MKDWKRSPEPPSMMGAGVLERRASDDSLDPAAPLDAATILPRLSAASRRFGGGKDAKLSLTNMCKKVIMRNIHAVQDLGDMPFRIAKDILEQCRVDQLIILEEASPHLLEDTEPIWKRNCLRDFVDLRKKYEDGGREAKSWRRAYFRKKGELEEQKEEAKQRIKDRYASHRAEKESKKLVVSDRPLMKARGARKVGAFSTTTAPGTKGHSLIMKARSGSAAAARLTGGGSNAFRPTTVGRAKAVGSQLQPTPLAQRPMVAPKRIVGQSQRLKEAAEWNKRAVEDSEDGDDDRLSDSRAPKRTRVEASKTSQPSSVSETMPAVRTGAERPPSAAVRPQSTSAASGASSGRKPINFFGSSRGGGGSSRSSPLGSPSSSSKHSSSSGVTVTTSRMSRPALPSGGGEGSSDEALKRRGAASSTPKGREVARSSAGRAAATMSGSLGTARTRSDSERQRSQGGPLKPPSDSRAAPPLQQDGRPPPHSTPTHRLAATTPPSRSPSLSPHKPAAVSASAAAMSSVFMPRNRFTSQRPRS